jgi:DNA-binding response OmpR family regulator
MLTASDELSDKLVGLSVGADDYTKPVVDVHVSNLRRKIGASYIRTVRGVGYRLGDVA